MKKSESVKEKIIATTIELIQSGSGDIEKITTRLIAQKAEVAIGLINYYFESKDQLIEICVQNIISQVIGAFKPEVDGEKNSISRLKTVAILVMDFLTENPSVSRISIIGDMKEPKVMDNTMKTVMGFMVTTINYNIPEKEKKLLLFSLTSILQSFYLRSEIAKESLGIDFAIKEERDSVINFMIDQLFKGETNENTHH